MNPELADMITKDVVDNLKWDDSVDDSDISVKVAESQVFLEGTVNSYAAKVSAAKDAYLVPGVKHVENNLKVHLADDPSLPDDSQITRNIADSLHWNSRIDSSGIEIETHDRTVTLRGKVSSFWEKYEAEDLVTSSYGVRGVVNLLEVLLQKTVEDEDIEVDIRNAFERSILIDEDKIEVQCNRGVVRLSGSVASYIIKREAMELAHYTRGVVNVEDEITIE